MINPPAGAHAAYAAYETFDVSLVNEVMKEVYAETLSGSAAIVADYAAGILSAALGIGTGGTGLVALAAMPVLTEIFTYMWAEVSYSRDLQTGVETYWQHIFESVNDEASFVQSYLLDHQSTSTPTTIIQGASADGIVHGTAGDDVLFDGGGLTATLDGGAGFNTALYAGLASNFTVVEANGALTVASATSHDTLENIQAIQFSDKTDFVVNDDQANIARLYSAALDRAPDLTGMEGWENIYNSSIPAAARAQGVYVGLAQTTVNGLSIAGGFTNSPEFHNTYGSLDDAGFISLLYNNVLDRAPSDGEVNAWLANMHNGETREMVLVGFAESPENIAKTAASWLVHL
jgi:hypothetical protein